MNEKRLYKIQRLYDSQIPVEHIYSSWYEGESTIDENSSKQNAYSWIKAPRYNGYSMEVGPLARMIISRKYNKGMSNAVNYDMPSKAKGKGLIDTVSGSLGHFIDIEDKKNYEL